MWFLQKIGTSFWENESSFYEWRDNTLLKIFCLANCKNVADMQLKLTKIELLLCLIRINNYWLLPVGQAVFFDGEGAFITRTRHLSELEPKVVCLPLKKQWKTFPVFLEKGVV